MIHFATPERPLRPSRLAKLFECPMSVVIEDSGDTNEYADTGSLVHSAAHAYHTTKGDQKSRVESGLAALEAAREQFRFGDQEKAIDIFSRYAADPINQKADVLVSEAKVRLTLPPHPDDPTGLPVVIAGTLDQVRNYQGVKSVWDIKNTFALTPDECVAKYLVQQATYVLAARETLFPDVEPGGLIYTPGYFKSRCRRHLPLPLTVETCNIILSRVPPLVAAIRRGELYHTPGEHCKRCPAKWPNCIELGVKNVERSRKG